MRSVLNQVARQEFASEPESTAKDGESIVRQRAPARLDIRSEGQLFFGILQPKEGCEKETQQRALSAMDKAWLEVLITNIVDGLLACREQNWLAELQQSRDSLRNTVQDLQMRLTVCEAKLTIDLQDQITDSEARFPHAHIGPAVMLVEENKGDLKLEAGQLDRSVTKLMQELQERVKHVEESWDMKKNDHKKVTELCARVMAIEAKLPQAKQGIAPWARAEDEDHDLNRSVLVDVQESQDCMGDSEKDLAHDFHTRIMELEGKIKAHEVRQPVTPGENSKRSADSSGSTGGGGFKAHDYFYEFEESVWDLAMLIGMPHVHFLGSLWIGFLFLVNVMMQLFLCFLINDYFTSRDIDQDTVDDMFKWRLHFAHAWDFVDKQSFRPLAHRICKFDSSVPMSSGVADVLGKIVEYMPSIDEYNATDPFLGHWLPYSEHVGWLMCCVSIVIWCLMVGEDLEEIWALTRSLLFLRSGQTIVRKTIDGYDWESTTFLRKGWCFTIIVLKSFVAISLGMCGTLYLCFTISLKDLLLNAAALQIVLDLDDIVFKALAPAEPCRMLQSMAPLPQSPSTSLAGLSWRPILLFATTISVICIASVRVLGPQSDLLIDARRHICSGNINFVTVRDRSGLIYSTGMPPLDWSMYTYSSLATLELIQDPLAVHTGFAAGSLSAKAAGMEGGYFSMTAVSQKGVKSVSQTRNEECRDLLASSNQASIRRDSQEVFRLILEEASGLPITSCDSVRIFCSADKSIGVRARQYCPVTCGCAYPGSSLVLAGEDNGCPPSCSQTPMYQNVGSSRNCSDDVVNGMLLQNYIQGLESYLASAPADWTPDVELMISRVGLEGCKVVTTPWSPGALLYPWSDMCVDSSSWFFQSLAFACPEACACSKRNLPRCPSSCT